MKRILTESDFKAFLELERGILFTYFGWSGPAQASRELLEKLDSEWSVHHPGLENMLYRIDPEGCPFASDWLREGTVNSAEAEAGFGGLFWIQKGEPLEFVRYAGQKGLQGIVETTLRYWGP